MHAALTTSPYWVAAAVVGALIGANAAPWPDVSVGKDLTLARVALERKVIDQGIDRATEKWSPLAVDTYYELADRLDELEAASPERWNGVDGEVYGALVDLQLWLYELRPEAESLPFAKRAELALKRIEAPHGASDTFARLLNRCARYRKGRAEYDLADALLDPARLERCVAAKTGSIAWALGTSAGLAIDRSRYGEALDRLQQAIEFALGSGWDEADEFEAWACSQIVMIEFERGRVEWAQAALSRQRALVRTLEAVQGADSTRSKQLLLSELRVDHARNDYRSAYYRAGHLLSEAPVGFVHVDRPDGLDWSIRLQVARAALAVDSAVGLELLKQVAHSVRAHPVDRAFSSLELALAALDQGDPEAASATLDEAEQLREDSRLNPTHVVCARLVAARSRAVRMGAAGAGGAGRPPLGNELARLRGALDSFRGAWLAAGEEPDGVGFLQFDYRVDLLIEAYLLAREALDADPAARLFIEELAATEALASLTRALGATTFDQIEAQKLLLTRGEGLVGFLPGSRHVLVWLFDGRGPAVFVLDEPSVSLAPLAKLVREVNHPTLTDERWRGLARAAAEQLFPSEARSRLAGWTRFSWVQPELLGVPSFDVLDVEGVGVIGLARPTTAYPTLPAWLALEHRALGAPRPRGVIALVDPMPPPFDPEDGTVRTLLAGTDPEVCVKGGAATTLTGPNASLEALVAATQEHDIALYWTHGRASNRPGEGAGFEVANANGQSGTIVRKLDLERAFAGTRMPRLVILGICGASRPEARRGEDASTHLGGTFLGLGADVVLAAPRAVHAASAKLLIDALLPELEQAPTFADALLVARQRAAVEFRSSHPHFWASLGAVGVGHRAWRD